MDIPLMLLHVINRTALFARCSTKTPDPELEPEPFMRISPIDAFALRIWHAVFPRGILALLKNNPVDRAAGTGFDIHADMK